MKILYRHQCMVYEGAPSKHLRNLARTIITKLQENRRCIYLNSPAMVSGMHCHLYAEGVNVAEQIAKGNLILTSERDHLVNGRFDVAQMLRMLNDAVRAARKAGYQGLWATGDMTWELGSQNNLDRLWEYERKLEDFIERNPAMAGVCMYHRDTLPPHALTTALATHQAVYINENHFRPNPEFQAFELQPA